MDTILIIFSVIFAFSAVVCFVFFCLYITPQMYRWYQVRRWKRLSNVVALTYDDGPDSKTSDALLDLLREEDVKATFYLVGFRSERVPEMPKKIRQLGHELGTHSYSHKHAWKVLPSFDCQDAHRGYHVLRDIVAKDAPYRPPFGKISLVTLISMFKNGRRVDWWTTPINDTDDKFEEPGQVALRVLSGNHPVVLMHSHHDEPHRRDYMLATTKAIIRQAKKRGTRLVTMSELTLHANSDAA